jgi:hypothetical protein
VVGLPNRYFEFNSWDKFKIPKPFAKIVVCYAEPILVPKESTEEDIEKICQQIDAILKKTEEENL